MAKITGKTAISWLSAAAFACVCAAPVSAGSDDLTTTAVKRFFLARADARCHLLSAPTAMVVSGGYVQARNALIRATGGMAVLNTYLDQARNAADAIACDAPQLKAQANAASDAYRTYSMQMHLTLTGAHSTWLGERSFAERDMWRLVQYQNSAAGDAAIGLYGTLENSRFTVMTHFSDGAEPYAARLLVRNADIVTTGLINVAPHGLSQDAPFGFSGDSALTFLARDSSTTSIVLKPHINTNSAGFSLGGDYIGAQPPVEARRFDFPTRAWRAIAQLDPREDIVVAFDFRDGTRYARFEIGDFITGLSYVRMPSPYAKGA